MALQFVLGDLSTDKKSILINKMLDIKQSNPEAVIYYIVPEHIKFDMESLLLTQLEHLLGNQQQAMLDIQVMSFTRLAWFLLPPNTKNKPQLTQVGLSMLIRQILQDKQEELLVYRNQIQYQGFIEKLLQLFEELYEGRISPENITPNRLDTFDGDYDVEEQRLKELAMLYQAFISAIEDKQLANYQSYTDLIQYIQAKESFDNHYIFIDHFYYFDAQQMALIMEMIRSFTDVWITLPLKDSDIENTLWLPIAQVPKNTYLQIKDLANYLNLAIKKDWYIQGPSYNYKKDILQLANYFRINTQNNEQQAGTAVIAVENVYYWQSDTLQTEIRHLSNQIHYLVHKQGYRYHDILVVARDMDRYQSLVGPYFKMNDIPYFFDHTSRMDQHPLMLWLESVLNLKRFNWQFNDLMYVLKSDLYYPMDTSEDNLLWTDDEINEMKHQKYLFENIILANGYLGYRFTNPKFIWSYDQESVVYEDVHGRKTQRTNEQITTAIRQWMLTSLAKPLDQWQDTFTGDEAAQWFYHLVDKSGVKDRLIFLRDQAIEEGDIEASRQHEQVWQVFVDTLNEFHQLYQDKTIEFNLFAELILTGLNEGSYHIIPPTMDQVTITNMASPQVKPAKICFIIGANNQVLPQYQESDSLLTTENRQSIQDKLEIYQYLTDAPQKQTHLELLLIHQLLLNATDQLYISFASNVNDQQVELAPHLKDLQKTFKINTTSFNSQMNYLTQPQMHTSDVGKYAVQLTPIIQMIRYHFEAKSPISDNLQSLLHIVGEYQEQHLSGRVRTIYQLIDALLYTNPLPDYIQAETARALYGEQINLSISKLEQFYKDPYSHFLTYGLRIREREQFALTPAKTGDYMHEFLDQWMTLLNQNDTQLAQLDEAEFMQSYQQTLARLSEDNRFNLLSSQPRFEAIQGQLNRTLYQFAQMTQLQQQRTRFEILSTEATFGLQNPLKGFDYHLSNGSRLSISGKIDRIDKIQLKGQDPFLQVIDYKSGNKSFDPLDVYYGIDLQILTYLNVAMHNYSNIQPLGAFYQPLVNSYQNGTAQTWQEQTNQAAVIEQLMENNRYKGFLTVDAATLGQIEPLLSEKKTSQIYPASLLKNGDYNRFSQYFTQDEFKLLSQYMHHLIKKAGEEIMEGKITLQPFKEEHFTLSMQAEYRVITGFDPTIHYNVYRNKTVTKDQLIDKIQQELEGENDA